MRGSDRHWLAPLERHRERRKQGVPTVTVMVGAAGAAEWIWKQWNGGDGMPCVLAATADRLTGAWLDQPSFLERVRQAIERELARLERIPLSELKSLVAGRSQGQLEELVTLRAAELDLAPNWLRWTLGLAQPEIRVEADRSGTVARLATLIGALPPLLVRPASTEPPESVARRLFEISEQAPGVDLGLAMDERVLTQLRTSAPARLISGLTEGLIRLRPRQNGAREHGSFIEYEEEGFARSRAESTLYEELQERARTRGLFALNVRLDTDPPMEVDLLCDHLKVAIEIDGYHHFRDAQRYRRDRRKDIRLQELGYLVVRVLAVDIDGELAHVLESIDRVVAERQRKVR